MNSLQEIKKMVQIVPFFFVSLLEENTKDNAMIFMELVNLKNEGQNYCPSNK